MNGQPDLRDRVNTIAEGLPGAELTHPFDQAHDAWKVGGKMFTCIGAVNPGVSVKTPDTETAAMLIETGVAQRAPYFHRSWVQLPPTVPTDELQHRIFVSYDTVRGGLTKKLQASLPLRVQEV
ncbi:MmcQ/YjbR family DNA-binding protein [Thalassococcus lentus]|uniref:MmcQ/YjbR family DNA-binding protein n=1 Tax=Thalassococcus lentus TaxID=1210524 RepID=A0ABT4XVD8_9RHOB|nr:MmcQ/YjbR family DNA-binding protein [Thalassococcus lentus]MDA7425935.1 MmcQ/YjbR family DNA-binding protein [Thalassococcus lentus]